MSEFVVWLANGRYLAKALFGDREPRMTADMEQAQRFPSRLAALGACSQGPAAVFDHAAILPYRPQDAPAFGKALRDTPELQSVPGAAGREGEGK